MTTPPAFSGAAQIEASLALFAERCGDPTALVYAQLFPRYPQMEVHFWRDTNGAIKGEMLSRTFDAILDFVGERRYADHMIGTEMVTHEGYEIPREIFATFFTVIRDAMRQALGAEWSANFDRAWTDMLAEIDVFVGLTPRTDVSNPYFKQLLEAFEAQGVPPLGYSVRLASFQTGRGSKVIATPFMQKRLPVVWIGPSSNTWPRWPPQWAQCTSVRSIRNWVSFL